MAAIDFPSPVEGLKHLSWIYTNGAWVKQPFDVTFILASSGNWESTYTTVDAESANWNSTYNTVTSLSNTWDDQFDSTELEAASGNWNSTYTTVTNESADWESTYTTVTNESADWGIDTIYDDSLLQAASGDWNNTYTTVSANSGNWNNDLTLKLDQTTQQTVINGAPIFNGGIESYLKDYSGVLAVDTTNRTLNDNSGAITVTWDSVGLSATNFTSLNDINAAGTVTADCGDSTEWCSTYTTVSSNSAAWGSAATGDFCNTTVLLNEVSACGGTMSVDGLLSASDMTTTTLTADGVYFNTGANRPPELGELVWDETEKTLDLGLENGVVLQVGEEQLINVQASEEIKDGQVVYASGAFSQGNTSRIVVSLYSASSAEGIDIGATDELFFLGIATQDIAQDTSGYITTFGKVRNINVYDGSNVNSDIVGPDNVNIGSDPDWPAGKVLYVSTSAGRLTNTPPESPNKTIPTAMVISQSSNGHLRTLFVRQEHGYHIDELHDVRVINPQQNDVLAYNSTLESWDNVTSNNWESTFTTVSTNSADWVTYSTNDISVANWVLDEDTLVSESDIKVPTQQSVKAYVDGIVTGINSLKGGYDVSTDTPAITAGIGVLQGDSYYVTVSGSFYGQQTADPGDLIIATTDSANLSSEWIVVNRNIQDELIDRWNSTYTTVSTQSADWADHFDSSLIASTSGDWNSTYTTVNTESADWDSTYTTVLNESASWIGGDYDDSLLQATSGSWNSTYTTMSANSANWDSTYTTVQADSATWGVVAGTELNHDNNSNGTFAALEIKERIGTTFPSHNNITQGNPRGAAAVDLQIYRTSADQVAAGPRSALLGGDQNKITTGGNYSVITCGFQNEIDGNYSTILGGRNNIINSERSIASGQFSKADHNDTFVFNSQATSIGSEFSSVSANTFNIRVDNGVRLVFDTTPEVGQVLTCLDADGHGKWQALPADEWNSTYTTVSANSGIWDNSAALAFNDGNTNSIEIGTLDSTTETGPRAISILSTRFPTRPDMVASGDDAIAIGSYTKASGNGSIAIGSQADAQLTDSLAIGKGAWATAALSCAFGPSSRASGGTAIGIGYSVQATGAESMAIGWTCQAKKDSSYAIGRRVQNDTADTLEIGFWTPDAGATRKGSIRMDDLQNVSFSIKPSPTAKTDGGADELGNVLPHGSEAKGTLGREMFAFRRTGDDFYIDANDAAGNITTVQVNNDDSFIQANSGNWESTYTTVSSNSATWDTTSVYTVGTLPAAATAGAGARAFVSDSDATHAVGLGTSPTSAPGTNFVPVYSNGTSWLIG